MFDTRNLFNIAMGATALNFIFFMIALFVNPISGPLYVIAILSVLVLLVTGLIALVTSDNFLQLLRTTNVVISNNENFQEQEIEEENISYDFMPAQDNEDVQEDEEMYLRLAPSAM